jgi:hypothetical protein
MQKIEVYTSISNYKDLPRDDIKVFSDYNKFVSPVMNAKIYKILPHKFLDCDISIWVDGNIGLLKPLEWYVENWLTDNDIVFFKHYKSKSLEWELKWIKYKFNRRSQISIDADEQVKYYEKIGLPGKEDMAMGGFIIRRHTPVVERFNEAWWAEICRWGQRDQLSLPMVLKRFPALKVYRVNEDIKNNQYLKYNEHNHFDT